MAFLEKLQKLPPATRKIILWAIVAIVGIIFLTFSVRNFQEKIKTFQSADFQDQIKVIKELKEKQ